MNGIESIRRNDLEGVDSNFLILVLIIIVKTYKLAFRFKHSTNYQTIIQEVSLTIDLLSIQTDKYENCKYVFVLLLINFVILC